MKHPLNNIVAEIQKQERKLSAEISSFIDEAYKMTIYLQHLSSTIKEEYMDNLFINGRKYHCQRV